MDAFNGVFGAQYGATHDGGVYASGQAGDSKPGSNVDFKALSGALLHDEHDIDTLQQQRAGSTIPVGNTYYNQLNRYNTLSQRHDKLATRAQKMIRENHDIGDDRLVQSVPCKPEERELNEVLTFHRSEASRIRREKHATTWEIIQDRRAAYLKQQALNEKACDSHADYIDPIKEFFNSSEVRGDYELYPSDDCSELEFIMNPWNATTMASSSNFSDLTVSCDLEGTISIPVDARRYLPGPDFCIRDLAWDYAAGAVEVVTSAAAEVVATVSPRGGTNPYEFNATLPEDSSFVDSGTLSTVGEVAKTLLMAAVPFGILAASFAYSKFKRNTKAQADADFKSTMGEVVVYARKVKDEQEMAASKAAAKAENAVKVKLFSEARRTKGILAKRDEMINDTYKTSISKIENGFKRVMAWILFSLVFFFRAGQFDKKKAVSFDDATKAYDRDQFDAYSKRLDEPREKHKKGFESVLPEIKTAADKMSKKIDKRKSDELQAGIDAVVNAEMEARGIESEA